MGGSHTGFPCKTASMRQAGRGVLVARRGVSGTDGCVGGAKNDAVATGAQP